MGAERVICFPHKSQLGSKEYCWLANLVNKFHFHGGIEMITSIIELPKTNITVSLLTSTHKTTSHALLKTYLLV